MKWWLLLSIPLCWAIRPCLAQLPEGDVHGYVYVEAFELRKEFALRLRAFPDWTAGSPPEGVLNPDQQARILLDLSKILADSCPLEVDGAPLSFNLDVIRFVRLDSELGVVPDEREEIPVGEAQVAAVFGAPLRSYPGEVSVFWNLFSPDSPSVLLSLVSRAGRSAIHLTPQNPSYKWLVPKGKDTSSLLPVPKVAPAPPPTTLRIPFFTLLFGALAILAGIAGRFAQGTAKIFAATAAALFLLLSLTAWALAGFPLREADPEAAVLSPGEADTLVHALLRNIYLSFDYREESAIYDTLAHSVHGDLLEKIYLDVRRGLELEESGGPRVRISHIDLRSCRIEPSLQTSALRADAEWVAVGSVTHWGHLHTRLNKYHAWLTIQPVDSTWKITGLEIVAEGRL